MRPGVLKAGLLIILCSSAPPLVHAAAGRTPGAFDVSSRGASTYTVPIVVPPGPRGMQPSLALTYDSKSGNGILGVGWVLAGLSSIERCSRTEAQDNVVDTIVMGSVDRFCLNGNRLRLVDGATYGAPNSDYATELADFSKITAYGGSVADGPEYFIVRAKTGLIYEYGRTEDSRVKPLDKTAILRWKLNKVSDRAGSSGNSYVVRYNDPDSSRYASHAVPVRISWAPTTAGGSAYTYEMIFNYEFRDETSDWQNGWVAGSPAYVRTRLSDITMQSSVSGSTVVIKKYNFGYELSPTTNRSRLNSITQCADSESAECLNPTQFTYQAGQLGVMPGSGSVPSGVSLSRSADFNGDGRDDLFYVNGTMRYVALSTTTGFGLALSTGVSSTEKFAVDRFSSDRDSILINDNETLTFIKLNNAGTAFTSTPTGISHPASTLPVAVDTDGNGLADLVWVGSQGQIMLRRNTTSGSGAISFAAPNVAATVSGTTPNGGTYSGGTLYTEPTAAPAFGLSKIDVNGDGRQDLYIDVVIVNSISGGTLWTTLLTSRSTWIYVPPQSSWVPKSAMPALRFNDDHCTDRLIGLVVHISKCEDVEATTVTVPGSAAPAQVADWDGDGRMDVLVDNGETVGIYRSNGSGFEPLLSSDVPIAANERLVVLDHDGDGLDDIARLNGSTISYYTHSGSGSIQPGDPIVYASQIPDLLSTVEDGNGVAASIDYVSGTTSIYTPGATVSEPLRNYSKPGTVVARVIHNDGIGGAYTRTFSYSGARSHTTRATTAGFEQVSETDSRTGFTRRTTYEQLYPLTGAVKKLEWLQPDEIPIFTSDYAWLPNQLAGSTQFNERYFPYASSVTNVGSEVDIGGARNGHPMTNVTTAYRDLDAYGNFGEIETTVTDQSPGSATLNQSWTTTGTFDYQPDTGNWCVGLPERVEVVRSAANGDTVMQATDFGVDYANCRINQTIVQPLSAYEVTTDIRYDDDSGEAAPDFGQPLRITVTGAGMAGRVRTITWNSTGQFPESVTAEIRTPAERAHDERTEFTYDLNLGLLETMTDPNDKTTVWGYDDFGRLDSITRADGSSTTWTYQNCTSGCLTPQHKITIVQQMLDAAGGSVGESGTYLDMFERPLAARTRLLGASYQWSELRYDELGRISRSSIPCFGGSTVSCASQWTQFYYDEIGRVESASHPTLQNSTYTYAGRQVAYVDAEGSASIKMLDPNGWLRRSTDANGYTQIFSYDAAGSLRSVVDDNSRTLFSATYDYGIGAFQRTSYDPGSVNLANYPSLPNAYHLRTYNALGELISWTDPKGQGFSATYDELSRPLVRTEPYNVVTYRWGYQLQNNELGRLQQIESTLGGTYRETYEYDALGRPWKTTITIPGDGNYTYESSYHAATQLLDTLKYPTSTGNCNFTVRFGYENGIMNRLTDASSSSACGSTGTVLWEASEMNAFGALTREQLGNGLINQRVFDPVSGQLEQIRTGPNGNDTLIQSLGYLFDNVGNLTLREDSNLSLTERFYYKSTNDQLHRLESSTLTPAGQAAVVNLRQTYDEPGDPSFGTIKTRTVPDGSDEVPFDQSITWTSFNYPSRIESNGEIASFSYGPDRQRWRMSFTRGGDTETTYYIGGLMEKVISDGIINFRHTIPAGSALALLSRKSTGSNTFNYLLFDHQGSVHAITNSTGTAETTLYSSFTAYGNRRSAETWSGAPSEAERDALDSITRQGYTFQTTIGSMGLNHMNGRVQDSLTGTFLSPDPYVTEPGYTQNFNRYGYVYNNPMTFTDPSGFDCESPSVQVSQQFEYVPIPPLQYGGRHPDAYLGPNQYQAPFPQFGSWQFGTGANEVLSARFGPCGDTTPDYAPQYEQGVSNIGDSTAGGVTNGAQWEPPMEEPLRGGFIDLLRQLNEWSAPSGMRCGENVNCLTFPMWGTPRGRLFPNKFPRDPIDIAKVIPTSQLSRISGNFNYVITQDGRLIVGRSTHTSLAVGADVRAAGEVQLVNGQIKWIDNASGHYQPTGTQLGTIVEDAFNSIGMDAASKFILRSF